MKKILTIGVDATPLTKPLTGVGQYTYFVLKEMLKNSPHHWILFIDKDLPSAIHLYPQNNIEIICLNQSNKWSNLFWRLFLLPRYLKQRQIDVFWSPCNILPLIKNKFTKYIITFHDMVHKIAPHTMSTLGRYKALFLYGKAISTAHRIITPSSSVASEISRYYPAAAQKIKIIWHGTNIPVVNNSAESDPNIKQLPQECILFIGTREPRKNLDKLLEAYALLPQNVHQQHHLVICGHTGWKTKSLHDKVLKLKLEKKVILTGYLSTAWRNDLLQNAALLVMPSLYEGFGLPVIEAMQYGLPIVLSDIPIFHEIAADAALFVDPDHIQAIAYGMQQVLSDTTLRKNLKEKSLKRGKLFRGWQRAATEILDVIQDE